MAVIQVLETDNLDQWRQKTNTISSALGDPDSLTTNSNAVVGAINELDGEHGDLNDLSTANKANFVSSINEIKEEFDNLTSSSALSRAALIAFA